jgi:5-methylcytosine-specific restriction protein A
MTPQCTEPLSPTHNSIMRPCLMPNCPEVVENGYCAAHYRSSDFKRKNANSRGYNYRWKQYRKWFLDKHPLCEDCSVFIPTQATEVHHKAKLADHPELQFVESNLKALCHRCHAVRTARGE